MANISHYIKVYVDSSHRSGDSKCKCGFYYHDPISNCEVSDGSPVYLASNSNDSEIIGIFYAIKTLHEKHGILNFRVFNDSVIACSMMSSDKIISKKLLGKHPPLKEAIEYFISEGINVRMEKLSRGHFMMKKCDKISKSFRREEE